MMTLNLLRCFPHRFLKHETPSGEKIFLCARCQRIWPRVAEYRTPLTAWQRLLRALKSNWVADCDSAGGPSLC